MFSLILSFLHPWSPRGSWRGGKTFKRVRKKLGRRNPRTRRRTHGDKVLMDQFQAARVVVTSDWCHKTFVFFVPNHRASKPGVVSCLLTRKPYIQASCSPYSICLGSLPRDYSWRKVLITAQNRVVLFRHIRTKLARNRLDLSQVLYEHYCI